MAASPISSPILAVARILVADDEKQIRDILALVLRKTGATVDLAEGGEAALASVRAAGETEHPYDLVLLDLMMPRCNGLQVLTELRKEARFSELPVIILSAVGDQRVVKQCQKLGIAGYLQKPPTMSQLVQAAESALWDAEQRAAQKTAAAKKIAVASITGEHPSVTEEDEADSSGEHPVVDAADTPLATDLGYPLCYEGFPKSKSYALRPAYFKCPICDGVFTAPRLVNRALRPKASDPLHLGLFDGAQDKAFLEHLTVEIVVCPKCLYAADKSGFLTLPATNQKYPSFEHIPADVWQPMFLEMNPWIQKKFLDTVSDRVPVAKTASDEGKSLFRLSNDETLPRTFEDGLASFRLASVTAETLAAEFREEAQARLQHKEAAYLLKQGALYERMKAAKALPEKQADAKRRECDYAAFKKLLAIRDIEFRVVQERLVCLTRRFFLADGLLQHITQESPKQAMTLQRKKALAESKQIMQKDRAEGGENGPVIERFLEPMENRLYEAEKECKA